MKFLTDSSCDISHEEAKEYDIEVLPILIIRDDEIYKDWYDFTPSEFYASLQEWNNLPTTSQVPLDAFCEAFERAYQEGYDAVIAPLINARGSGTYQSACIARTLFFEKERARAFTITVIDTGVYSYLIGGVLIDGVKLAREGKDVPEIVEFLENQYQKICAYAVVYTLDYLQRAGRINSVAGFVGTVLDIKPIIKIADGEINAVERARGKKKSVHKLLEMVKREIDPKSDTIYIIHGDMEIEMAEITQQIKETFPNHKTVHANLGSVIAINSGPHILALGFIRK